MSAIFTILKEIAKPRRYFLNWDYLPFGGCLPQGPCFFIETFFHLKLYNLNIMVTDYLHFNMLLHYHFKCMHFLIRNLDAFQLNVL